MGFFIGRTILFDTVSPIAMGFLGALIGTGYSFYATAAFLILGLATKLSGEGLMRYVLAVGLLCSINLFALAYLIKRKNLYFTNTAQSLAAGICTLVGGIGASAALGFEWRQAIITSIEACLVYFLVFVLKKGALILTASKRKMTLTNEEAISLAILFGCLIAGASDIHVGEVSLRYFLSFTSSCLQPKWGTQLLGCARDC
jgi:stage II sporulation protein E